MKNYVFVFVGEFGYELLNWQGVVRKLRDRLPADCRIVACSRTGMEPFYETADAFVDLSGLESYQQSTAAGYTVLGVDVDELAQDVHAYVIERLPWLQDARTEFVFSFERNTIERLTFGAGGIYADLEVGNNRYTKIEPDLSERGELEAELGFSLEDDYLLCQAARREIIVRSHDLLQVDALLRALAERVNVVLLDFETGRHLDSYSVFDEIPGCRRVKASTFSRQGCLIHFADSCLFFTEGDFRSHLYVPPFLGRTVHAVAPESVYHVAGFGGVVTAPIAFWNARVFRFGGAIRAHQSESILRNEQSARQFTAQITRQIPGKRRTEQQPV